MGERHRVGETIRRARVHHRLMLGDVARAAGISVAYLSEIERGKKRLPPTRVASFAAALGLDAHALAVSAATDEFTDYLDAFRAERERE